MPFTNNPATNDIDKVRLEVGDIHEDEEWLTDDTYDYYLAKYNNNIYKASLDAAKAILFKLSRTARERTGDIEIYSDSYFKNYRDALIAYITNPSLSPVMPIAYAGGISKSDMTTNDEDTDHVRPNFPSQEIEDNYFIILDDI